MWFILTIFGATKKVCNTEEQALSLDEWTIYSTTWSLSLFYFFWTFDSLNKNT